MDILDPTKDAAALDPDLQHFAETLVTQLTAQTVPALKTALQDALDGLTITIVVSRKTAA